MPNICNLCNKEVHSNPLIELNGIPKAAQYFPQERDFCIDCGIDLKIYQCQYCGLLQHFMQPVEYYKEVITAASLSQDSRNFRLNQMKQLLNTFNLSGKEILDVGAGEGLMLDILKQAGFKPTGIEAGKNSVIKGVSAGRNLINGYIGDRNIFNENTFDAFICLNYLQHLPNPGNIIRIISSYLKPNGVGYITVPNVDYLIETNSFYEFVVDHISYFTVKTLTQLFENNGFQVIKSKLINNDNDIAIIVKKKKQLHLSDSYFKVELLIKDLQELIAKYKKDNKKVAIFGAGHRTLALLALANLENIECVIDDAEFKQNKFIPILHKPIKSSQYLKDNKIDLVIVMVPGIYPNKVIEKLKNMNLKIEIAKLEDNKIKFI